MEKHIMDRQQLAKIFPDAMDEDLFVSRTISHLHPLGFTSENTLACICLCRDRLTRPLEAKLQKSWDYAFSFSGLGGIIPVGRTGFVAAHSNAPNMYDRERFVFINMAHIGMDEKGTPGNCQRAGQTGTSKACGALLIYQEQLLAGDVDYRIHASDTEMGLMKRRLRQQITQEISTDIIALTRTAHDVSVQDMEKLIQNELDAAKTDWAFFSGIQIHTPIGDFVQPIHAYTVIQEEKRNINLLPSAS